VQHLQYLQITNPDSIRREAQSLTAKLPKDSPRVQEVNRKRIEILEKRLEKYGKISENRQVIDAQCRAIEDVLQLIREQSMTMSDPQQMSERLDMLVKDVESTEDTVRASSWGFPSWRLSRPYLSRTCSSRWNARTAVARTSRLGSKG